MIRLIPNILTLARFVLTVVFLFALSWTVEARDKAQWLDIATALFIIAGLTDIIDGHIARKWNVTTKFGRIMDPLADKALVCGAFICFAFLGIPATLLNLSESALTILLWAVAAIITAREIIVTIVRQIAESHGVNFAATISGKLKMFIQSITIVAIMVKTAHLPRALWANWFVAVALLATVIVTAVSLIAALSPARRNPQQPARKTPKPQR